MPQVTHSAGSETELYTEHHIPCFFTDLVSEGDPFSLRESTLS